MKTRRLALSARHVQHAVLHMVVAAVMLGAPAAARAQVVISEIMYDLEGSDGGREWIEIANGGGSAVELADWRFFEADTNHKLTAVQGGTTLAPGGFAVIAANATQFLSDTSGFAGMLFDSSFSLSNTGELLALRDSALADMDSVTYASEWGAAGDGKSLQMSGGSWIAAAPTPGAANATTPAAPPQPAGGGGSGGSPGGSGGDGGGGSSGGSAPPSGGGTSGGTSSSASAPVPKPQISAHITGPSTVTVGALAEFRGEVRGLKGEPIENARLIWNFGDGASTEARTVRHSFRYPGEYVVVLSAASGEYSATAHFSVRAVAAELRLSAVAPGPSGYIEIANDGAERVDLSRWQLRAGASSFTLPSNTIMAARAALRLAAETTGLVVAESDAVVLAYPSGSIAAEFTWPAPMSQRAPVMQEAALSSHQIAAAVPAAEPPQQAPVSAPSVRPRVAASPAQPHRSAAVGENAMPSGGVGDGVTPDRLTARIANIPLPPPAGGCGEERECGAGVKEGFVNVLFGSGRLGLYLAALIGISALGVLSFLSSSRRSAPEPAAEASPTREADEYEIVE